MSRLLPSSFKTKPEPAVMAPRAEPEVPTSTSLSIKLTATNVKEACIAASNVEDWNALQDLLRRTPSIEILTCCTCGQKLPLELVIRFTNETSSAHENETIPDSILTRFTTVRVELPFSVRATNGPRHLGILNIHFFVDGRKAWRYRAEATKLVSVKGSSPHLMAFVHHVISNIEQESGRGVYDGALDSQLLKHARGKVEYLLEDTEDWLPAGWTVQTLEQGILDHEDFAMRLSEGPTIRRLSFVVWLLALGMWALMVERQASSSKIITLGLLVATFQCAMSARMAGKF